MKSLVTGGAGFIGSKIVDKLLDLGHEVISIDNESSEFHNNFYWNDKSSNHKLDICDYENTRVLYNEVDYVFHTAAEARIQPSITNPSLAIKTNALGTAVVLQCSKEARVNRLIYSSTSSAYGRNNKTPNIETQPDHCITPYSVAKVAGEKLAKVYYELFGLETITLRYFNVYGDRQPLKGHYAPVIGLFFRQRASGEPLTIIGDGEQRRDFTHINDVVEANIIVATKNINKENIGEVYNVGTGINYSINEIAKLISNNTINVEARLGESRITLADNNKIKNVFNWQPTMFLPDYIKEYNENE